MSQVSIVCPLDSLSALASRKSWDIEIVSRRPVSHFGCHQIVLKAPSAALPFLSEVAAAVVSYQIDYLNLDDTQTQNLIQIIKAHIRNKTGLVCSKCSSEGGFLLPVVGGENIYLPRAQLSLFDLDLRYLSARRLVLPSPRVGISLTPRQEWYNDMLLEDASATVISIEAPPTDSRDCVIESSPYVPQKLWLVKEVCRVLNINFDYRPAENRIHVRRTPKTTIEDYLKQIFLDQPFVHLSRRPLTPDHRLWISHKMWRRNPALYDVEITERPDGTLQVPFYSPDDIPYFEKLCTRTSFQWPVLIPARKPILFGQIEWDIHWQLRISGHEIHFLSPGPYDPALQPKLQRAWVSARLISRWAYYLYSAHRRISTYLISPKSSEELEILA